MKFNKILPSSPSDAPLSKNKPPKRIKILKQKMSRPTTDARLSDLNHLFSLYACRALGRMCNFRDPNLGTFYFSELIHFLTEWRPLYKHSGTSVLVTLLKMRPYYSQSSRENTTPTSGISPLDPLASYKEVPPGTCPPCFLPQKVKTCTNKSWN